MPENVLDSIRTGLVTTEELEATPYGFRVTWISWDSGFRGSGIRVGDRIVGVGAERYDVARRQKEKDRAPGGYAEDQYWAAAGATDGQRMTLAVDRDGEALDVTGAVRAERIYTNKDGRRTIGPNGPPQQDNDGFYSSWSSWLEKFVSLASRVFDGGWRASAFNNRQLLEEAVGDRERVELLARKYPGPFATAMQGDWRDLVESLKGTKYDVTEADLAYRAAGEHRAEDAAAVAAKARAAFIERHGAVPLDAIPPTDPITGDRAAVAGKVVVLPPTNQTISEGGRGWFCVGGNGRTMVMVDQQSKPMRDALYAAYRFRQLVTPALDETHELIVRLTDMPRMVATPTTVYTGILSEVVADTVGGQVFVDVTVEADEPPFTGEAELRKLPSVVVRDDLDPAGVMQSFFAALKLDAQEPWEGFFATWSCEPVGDGTYEYKPDDPPASPQTLGRHWGHAREMITGPVYDVRVARVGRVLPLPLRGGERPGAPRVEQVTIEADPVGLFDGEYRAFKDVNVHRVWQLQRVNGGPWRITVSQGI